MTTLRGWTVRLTDVDFARIRAIQRRYGHRAAAAAIRHAVRHQYGRRKGAHDRGWPRANMMGRDPCERWFLRLDPEEMDVMLPAIKKAAGLDSKADACRYSIWSLATAK